LITGEEGVGSGHVAKPEKTVIGYFSQNIEDMKGRSVLEEVKSAAGRVAELGRKVAEYEAKLSSPDLTEDEMTAVLEKYGEVQAEFERLGGYNLEARAAEIITGLGFHPEDHHRDTGSFSGGWK